MHDVLCLTNKVRVNKAYSGLWNVPIIFYRFGQNPLKGSKDFVHTKYELSGSKSTSMANIQNQYACFTSNSEEIIINTQVYFIAVAQGPHFALIQLNKRQNPR